MNRRAVLAGMSAVLVGGLGGCLGEGAPESDAGGTEMQLTLTSVDEGPDTLAFTVDVAESRLTSSAVPLVNITVENAGDEPATWLYAPAVGEDEIVFPCQHATPDGVVIGFEAEVNRLRIDDEGCVRTESELDRGSSPLEAELAPGESLQQQYAIAGFDPNLDGVCPPVTTYRFDCPYEDHGRWGFEVKLTSQGD